MRTEEVIEYYGRKFDIPGMMVAVANEKEQRIYSYGYANKKRKVEVRDDTLFEIASLSKAFTALLIFWLEENQMISLNDNISKYLEGLSLCLKSSKEDLTDKIKIRDLLYHTSGLVRDDIYIGGTLRNTEKRDLISNISRHFLDENPGVKYEYTSINYVLLAIIIENVVQKDFSEVLEEKVFKVLGLKNTYADRERAIATGKMSCGYKIKFCRNRFYRCTDHKEEIASGYVISNIQDMIRWGMIQLGIVNDIPENYKLLIKKSHVGDSDVKDHDNFYYAGGWHVHRRESWIMHMGNNPAFSAYIEMRPKYKSMIIVLMNMNNAFTMKIADDIRRNRIKEGERSWFKGTNDVIDKFNTLICVVNILLSIILVTIPNSISIWYLMYMCIGTCLLAQYIYISVIKKINIRLSIEWIAGSYVWSYISYLIMGMISVCALLIR